MLNQYFADLHIHIGRDMYHRPVKITASANLTLLNIVQEAKEKKGIDLIGIIDAHSPAILEEITQLLHENRAKELSGGGIVIDGVTILLGSEIEVYNDTCRGPFHILCYFPTVEIMKQFSNWLKDHMHNIHLSTQRFHGTAKKLQQTVKKLNGIFIPAHVFTPFKSLYGKGVQASLTEVLDAEKIDAIELGLSADTNMADSISELHAFTYITNSDSHSLAKIAREYQLIKMRECSFNELKAALKQSNGRKIIANYGMNPKLGKYFCTICQNCSFEVSSPTNTCPRCHKHTVVTGVFDRIQQLKDSETKPKRPAYHYQVPLEYIPGIGSKTLQKLIASFSTEMNIIHYVTYEELVQVVQPKIAKAIIGMRHGKMNVEPGGGGKYGRIKRY